VPFSQDNRTRVMLFATKPEPASRRNRSPPLLKTAITFNTRSRSNTRAGVPNLSGVTSVIVRLHDNLGDVGDVLVGITVHGIASNRVRIGIGHVGGGPPYDVTSAADA
jgi:hypothetical protein